MTRYIILIPGLFALHSSSN